MSLGLRPTTLHMGTCFLSTVIRPGIYWLKITSTQYLTVLEIQNRLYWVKREGARRSTLLQVLASSRMSASLPIFPFLYLVFRHGLIKQAGWQASDYGSSHLSLQSAEITAVLRHTWLSSYLK